MLFAFRVWPFPPPSAFADEHATRMALMSEDWIETVVEPMKALVEQRAIETRTQDKDTLEMVHETFFVVPSECQMLALNGLTLLSGEDCTSCTNEVFSFSQTRAICSCLLYLWWLRHVAGGKP